MQDYLACVQSVDDNIGRFLDYLDKAGLAGNTLVIYTSDQGFFLGEHNMFDKRFMYEESLRTPLLMRWPKQIKPGGVSQRMVLNVDFAPTFLDAAGAKIPADMQGRSFLPLLAGKAPKDWRTSMYYRYYHPGHHNVAAHYGVRTMRYKLIYFNKLDQWELYDLQKDRMETRNEYNNPAYGEIMANLKQELRRLKKDLKDEDQFQDKLPADDVDGVGAPEGRDNELYRLAGAGRALYECVLRRLRSARYTIGDHFGGRGKGRPTAEARTPRPLYPIHFLKKWPVFRKFNQDPVFKYLESAVRVNPLAFQITSRAAIRFQRFEPPSI